MNLRKYSILAGFTAAALAGFAVAPQRAAALEGAGSQEVEVLTRGPVHEAFAGTISYDPQQGILVSVKPPEAIEEIPPEQQLEGDNVVWIPGYWAWDEDQNDFLWVSGIWRNLPPGRQWVPGYWSDIEGGYQWTSGYWADSENTEVSYLPEPPRSVETGPNIEAPSENYSWVPGSWAWRESRYAWRSGYWAECRPNWVWEPSCYRWTRRGYVYVDGYWDYAVARRGVLFAPVHFGVGVYSRPGFCYSPATVISISVFTDHLFLRPTYGHYYFGDYYAPRYRDAGYYASFSYHSGRRGCDPIYAYQSWENRGDRDWQQNRRHDFEYRRDHEDARPPRTWAVAASRGGDFEMARPFDRVVGSRGNAQQRFKAVDQSARERFVAQTQEVRKFGRERQQIETRGERPKAGMSADRTNAARSPIAARSGRAERGDIPPKRLEGRAGSQNPQRAATAGKGPGQVSRPDRQAQPQIARKADPAAQGKSASRMPQQAAPQAGRKIQPNTERQANQPRGQSKPAPAAPRAARQTEAAPARQFQPRQAAPQAARKSQPEVKRQPVSPPPSRARTEQNRQVAPSRQQAPPVKRQEAPAVKRQQAPAAQRQEAPAMKRQAAPSPQNRAEPRRANPPPVQRAAPKPSRQMPPQQQPARRAAPAAPQRQQVQRPQPQRAPQTAQPQRSAPKQEQARPAQRSDAQKKKEEERRNKMRQAI